MNQKPKEQRTRKQNLKGTNSDVHKLPDPHGSKERIKLRVKDFKLQHHQPENDEKDHVQGQDLDANENVENMRG